MKKILILGGGGFIGGHLSKRLFTEGNYVRVVDIKRHEYFNENELLGNSSDPQKTYIEEIMPAKIALNMKYIHKPTLGQDFKIMGMTFLKIIHR